MPPENAKPIKPPKAPPPFPWECRSCRQMKVVPTKTDYALDVRFDNQLVPIVANGIDIPTCQNCGEKVITVAVDDQVNAALHRHLNLLLPTQIRDGIERLGMSNRDIAARLGVSEELLWKWANGFTIQSRAMDNYLRVFFQFPQVREMLIAPALAPGDAAAAVPTAT